MRYLGLCREANSEPVCSNKNFRFRSHLQEYSQLKQFSFSNNLIKKNKTSINNAKPTLVKLPFVSLYSIIHCALFLPMVGNAIISFSEPLFNVAMIFDSKIEWNLESNNINPILVGGGGKFAPPVGFANFFCNAVFDALYHNYHVWM